MRALHQRLEDVLIFWVRFCAIFKCHLVFVVSLTILDQSDNRHHVGDPDTVNLCEHGSKYSVLKLLEFVDFFAHLQTVISARLLELVEAEHVLAGNLIRNIRRLLLKTISRCLQSGLKRHDSRDFILARQSHLVQLLYRLLLVSIPISRRRLRRLALRVCIFFGVYSSRTVWSVFFPICFIIIF